MPFPKALAALFYSATFCIISLLSHNSFCATSTKSLAPELNKQRSLPILDNSAETLYSITEATLDKDNHWQRRIYISIRINDSDAARDYGRISIPFNHYYSDLELEFANTISNTGKLSSVSKEALQIRVTGGGQDFYSDSSEMVFSLPDISPGSILEFQYTRKSKTLALNSLHSDRSTPYWFQNTSDGAGWRADYVHNFRYSLKTPKTQPIYSKTYSGFPKHKRSELKDSTQYLWEMSNIKGIQSERWMAPFRNTSPSVHYSTLNSWGSIDEWSWLQVKDKLAPTEQLKRIIDSFELEPNASNEDKVKAVYGYVQNNIRYVFAHLGRGGYEPHYPKSVLNVNYGDCKDQSVLTIALLRAMGINALPALIETPRAGESDPDIVSLMFDHMIVHIPASEQTSSQWLDTTGDQSLYPGISNYLAGQNVLIVDGKGGQMTKMPSMGPNKATVFINYQTNQKGNATADVSFNLIGAPEQNIRSWWTRTTDRENALNQYLSTLFGNYSSLESKVKYSEDIWRPVELTAQYIFKKDPDNNIQTFAASITQAIRMFTDSFNLPLPETRKSSFYDRSPLELEMRIFFQNKVNETAAVIQSADNISNDTFELTYSGKQQGNSYELIIHYLKKPLNLNLSDYKEYYQQLQHINDEHMWLIKMLPTKGQEPNALDTQDDNTVKNVEFYISKARTLIEKGQFLEALIPAKKAVDLQNTNGEAWYVLAMAQGFNAQIDESTLSFNKAQQLGYQP